MKELIDDSGHCRSRRVGSDPTPLWNKRDYPARPSLIETSRHVSFVNNRETPRGASPPESSTKSPSHVVKSEAGDPEGPSSDTQAPTDANSKVESDRSDSKGGLADRNEHTPRNDFIVLKSEAALRSEASRLDATRKDSLVRTDSVRSPDGAPQKGHTSHHEEGRNGDRTSEGKERDGEGLKDTNKRQLFDDSLPHQPNRNREGDTDCTPEAEKGDVRKAAWLRGLAVRRQASPPDSSPTDENAIDRTEIPRRIRASPSESQTQVDSKGSKGLDSSSPVPRRNRQVIVQPSPVTDLALLKDGLLRSLHADSDRKQGNEASPDMQSETVLTLQGTTLRFEESWVAAMYILLHEDISLEAFSQLVAKEKELVVRDPRLVPLDQCWRFLLFRDHTIPGTTPLSARADGRVDGKERKFEKVQERREDLKPDERKNEERREESRKRSKEDDSTADRSHRGDDHAVVKGEESTPATPERKRLRREMSRFADLSMGDSKKGPSLPESLNISMDVGGVLIRNTDVTQWEMPSYEELLDLREETMQKWMNPLHLKQQDLVKATGLGAPYICYLFKDPNASNLTQRRRVETYSVLKELMRKYERAEVTDEDFLRLRDTRIKARNTKRSSQDDSSPAT